MSQLDWKAQADGYQSGIYRLYRVVHGFTVWKRGDEFKRLGEASTLTEAMRIAEKDAYGI